MYCIHQGLITLAFESITSTPKVKSLNPLFPLAALIIEKVIDKRMVIEIFLVKKIKNDRER